jgi:hypothetical protein
MELQGAPALPKRVLLSFSLVEDGNWTAPRSSSQMRELMTLFPTTCEVAVIPPVLIVRVKELPPKPWPLTVAGMPLRITTDDESSSFDRPTGARTTCF